MSLSPATGADDLLLAALVGVFDPLKWICGGDEARLSALAAVSVEQAVDGRWYWALTMDSRRAGLARLPSGTGARRALFKALPLEEGDDFGAALRAALAAKPGSQVRGLLAQAEAQKKGQPRPPRKGKGFDANTLAQAIQLLREAEVALPEWAADPATLRALRRVVVVQQRALAQHRLLPHPFRGRKRELAMLERFVGGDSPADSIGALIVTGLGGTGKSTLIEALRRRVERQKGMIFLVFDLDQFSLRSGERLALTMEFLRQTGLLLPELDQDLSRIRNDLRNLIPAAGEEGARVESASSAVYAGMGQIGMVLKTRGLSKRKLVVVFDTFEQALVVGQDRVRLLADWLALLRVLGGLRDVRVILAGREAQRIAAIDGLGLTVEDRIGLDELGVLAGRAKLRDMFRRFGIPHLDLVPKLIAAYGSNPLLIEIIASFSRDRPPGEIAELAEDPGEDLREEWGAEMRQGILYTRILNRIADPDLRPLANPGLVLRQISPELIEEVLAGPCGLSRPLPPGRAAALHQALAQHVWMVRPTPDGEGLEHLPDLRRVMLPQILPLPAAKEVAQAAARWFEARSEGYPGPDLWEALYYRALIDPEALDDRAPEELTALASHLGVSARDLPPKAQAQLAEATGLVLTVDQISTLSGDARDRSVRKRQARQVSEGLEATVMLESGVVESSAPSLGQVFVQNPDLARAAFANAEYRRLVAAAPDLISAMLTGNGDPLARDTAHPAWLATLATLSATEDAANIIDHLWPVFIGVIGPDRTDLLPSRAMVMRQPAKALLCYVLAWVTERLIGQVERGDENIVLSSPMDWREIVLLRAPEDERPLDAGVVAGIPILHPVVLQDVLGPAYETMMPAFSEKERDVLIALQHNWITSHADLTGALAQLDRVVFRFDLPSLSPDLRRVLFPGCLPEFHAPLRLILTDARPGRALADAIGSVFESLPWWPPDLGPELFSGRGAGPTLIGAVIGLLDRAGHLPKLAHALAALPDADPRAVETGLLIGAFLDLWKA